LRKHIKNQEEALNRASDAHNQNPFENHRSNGSVPLPQLPPARNQPAPFSSGDAWSGGPHGRNVGNSSSVVVDADVYNTVIQRVDMAEHQAGADMYNMCNTIDEICETIFMIPETNPRIKAMTDTFKKSLGPFRSLTEEVATDVRRFTGEIANIDHGNMSEVAMVQTASRQSIQQVSSSIDRQVSNMERTSESYKIRGERLSDQAQREQQRADRLAESIQRRALLGGGMSLR